MRRQKSDSRPRLRSNMLPEMSLGSFRLFLCASDLEPKPSLPQTLSLHRASNTGARDRAALDREIGKCATSSAIQIFE
jgi:hypothetical protein